MNNEWFGYRFKGTCYFLWSEYNVLNLIILCHGASMMNTNKVLITLDMDTLTDISVTDMCSYLQDIFVFCAH